MVRKEQEKSKWTEPSEFSLIFPVTILILYVVAIFLNYYFGFKSTLHHLLPLKFHCVGGG
jgi:hypothetical protein